MMDILMSETCCAHKTWNKIASDIELVFHSSTITMMHGPINISWEICLIIDTNNSEGKTVNNPDLYSTQTRVYSVMVIRCPFAPHKYLKRKLTTAVYRGSRWTSTERKVIQSTEINFTTLHNSSKQPFQSHLYLKLPQDTTAFILTCLNTPCLIGTPSPARLATPKN